MAIEVLLGHSGALGSTRKWRMKRGITSPRLLGRLLIMLRWAQRRVKHKEIDTLPRSHRGSVSADNAETK